MSSPHPNKAPQDDDAESKSSRPLNRYLTEAFSTVISLPSAIYSRGSDHGSRWNRMYRGSDDTNHNSAQNYEQHESRQKTYQERASSEAEPEINPDMEYWFQRVTRALERGEVPDMNKWWREFEGKESGDIGNEGQRDYQATTLTQKDEDKESMKSSWTNVFPAWSGNILVDPKHSSVNEATFRGSEEQSGNSDASNSPLCPTSERQDCWPPCEGIERLLEEAENWCNGPETQRFFEDAEWWSERVKLGFERDSRLWEEDDLFGPTVPFSKPLSTLFSMGMRPFLPQESAMGYLLYSEYSPLHLEHEEGFDPSWRRRFEDLLLAQDGKKMLEDDASRDPPLSGVDWLARVMPLLKDSADGAKGRITIASTSSHQPVVQVEELLSPPDSHSPQAEEAGPGPNSEMDLYEQHFREKPDIEDLHVTHRAATKAPKVVEPQKPSILSTLTSTERHVAADGSITTKTVLKKRFTDGSEENAETVETMPPGAAWARKTGADLEQPADQAVHDESRGKSTGWFWSR